MLPSSPGPPSFPVSAPRNARSAVRLELLHGVPALAARRESWEHLAAHAPTATPFQRPAWLLPAFQHLRGGRLLTLALYSEFQLVGLIPLLEQRIGIAAGPSVYRLLGRGVSDWLDAPTLPGWEGLLCQTVAAWVDSGPPRVLDLELLPPGAALSGLRTALPGRCVRLRQDPAPVLELPRRVEDLLPALPRNLRKNLAYYRRRLVRAGGRLETAGPAETAEFLAAFFRTHAARWRRRGLPGAFFRPAVRAFHRVATAEPASGSGPRLHGLRLHGQLAAVLYCLVAGGRACYYAGGFDPRWSHLSPGTLLIHHAMEAAVREGALEFDFLRGNERYKSLWGAHVRWGERLILRSPHASAAAAAALIHAGARAARRVREEWSARTAGGIAAD
ncbi:MAG: GNAT family N-acetyltransferase [Armatimonadetes bacterium]|nr:GNAT family N-acetyltransferase [Armatimonadota bacterium]